MTRVGGRRPGAAPKPKALEPEYLLESGRALGVLAGLFVFAAGFAIAAGFEAFAVIASQPAAGRPVYYVGLGSGFVGLGLVALFMNRGTVPLPERALWSPLGVRLLARSAGWPATPTLWLLYAIGLWGVIGNIVIPLGFTLK
jgi:hypothetical protein